MIKFTFRLNNGEEITAAYHIKPGVIFVYYEGVSKSAAINADHKAAVQIRNELLRSILIERAMRMPGAG